MTAPPGEHDIEVYSGASFSEMVEWRDPAGDIVDLNLYNALMEVRAQVGGPLVVALSTGNGRIIPQVDKRARLYLTDTETRLLDAGKYRYDLLFERISDSFVTPLLKGRFNVTKLITQDAP